MEVRTLAGPALADALDELARLRIAVFRAYPYLYDGDLAYEAGYLREFAAAPGSALIAAIDGGRVVGAATASPMAAQKPEFRAPFEQRGIDIAGLFYFGESVLLPEYRGQGIGHAFFDHREAQARGQGADRATFAAVARPDDHPARPSGHVPLDGFWLRRGYRLIEGMTTALGWKEIGNDAEIAHEMRYWMREF